MNLNESLKTQTAYMLVYFVSRKQQQQQQQQKKNRKGRYRFQSHLFMHADLRRRFPRILLALIKL